MATETREQNDTIRDVVTAAQEWVERIYDHPNQWADEEDFALIEAVRRHVPGVRCQWTENPAYEGWIESWHPEGYPVLIDPEEV